MVIIMVTAFCGNFKEDFEFGFNTEKEQLVWQEDNHGILKAILRNYIKEEDIIISNTVDRLQNRKSKSYPLDFEM